MNGRTARRIRKAALEDFNRRSPSASLKSRYLKFNDSGQVILNPQTFRAVYYEHRKRHG